MPYANRAFTCRCGAGFTKRAPAGSDQLCIMCSIEAMAASLTQMHVRSGPAWDAWCDRMHRLMACPLAHVPAAQLRALGPIPLTLDRSRGIPSPGG